MKDFIDAYSWINMRYLLQGLWITVVVSLASIAGSYVIGTILGIIRYVNIKILSPIVGFIIDVIRNLPLLLIIFFTYFGLPNLGLRPSSVWATIVAMIVFESSMIAEIVRSGIVAVPSGQMEGARANGLSYSQTMYHIILPQAMKKMIPALVSQFISLIKDTSLATIIVLPDLMHNAQIVYGENTSYILPMFLMLAIMYFVVCYALSLVSRSLERRMS
ncbi:glutamine ABC transporter permease [Secundilactobacillus paracollinoides]|uniref:Glutamine ABC transporter permease n=1 Tax=Secundilactobacillus paracollinoides TaxID=240427 RepID=A0A1B2IZ47_9LACO|nr:amino acid ABC transporter permease [Secundilactobacillus paracollinoides]ANZ61397.1 glutamine ABC transporter permease [Secundilactobacillus paracollinoides]ANZ64210.1 glutamine ABC transporter permease [Secundilactobacillus paracollinoides]ANZ67317.1 glutamine ABC transporter permease [Secundilactobacillus paracollinoides]KRL77938.1 glutamine ABC transporter, permease [Secundilactobacillus paracollinoides DSM 15502 = JCM 11969]